MGRLLATASSDGVDEAVLTVDLPPNPPLSLSAPLKMSESRFEGFEKMTKKQNKEQVPPPAETESKKPSSSKTPKKANNSNTVSQPTHKNLEEAFKAVSEAAAAAYYYLFAALNIRISFFLNCFK